MVGQISQIFFFALAVWFAVRLKRHPEKDGNMKKAMAEQRGTEYEDGMRKFFMINYLTAGFAFVMAVLIQIIFGMDDVPSMMIAGCVPWLVVVITQWHFTGKFSKLWMVCFAVWLVATIVCLIFYVKLRKPATVEVSDDYITAKGSAYSASIPVADIATTTILSDWPAISHGTDYLSTDKVNIGHFRLKSGESCMMFLCVDGGPVLEVRTVDGKLYYFNCATEEESLEMIAKVKQIVSVKLSAASRHCEERSSLENKHLPWIASSCLLAMTVKAKKNNRNNGNHRLY